MNKLIYNVHLEKCKKDCEKKRNILEACLKKNNYKIKFCYTKRYEYEKCLIKNVDKEEKL